MEPNNKLENQFRDKLNSRQIQPSPNAWDRLDAMLTVAENKKPKRKMNWLLIAAGFVGILFTGLAIYQLQPLEIKKNNGVVIHDNKLDKKIKNNQTTNQINNNDQVNIQNQVVVTIKSKSFNQNQINKTNFSKNGTVNNQNQNLIPSNQSIINQNKQANENQSTISQVNQKIEIISKETINVNPETLLAQIESSKTQKTEILPQQIKVNANSLLSEVDGVVTQEFRETKFSKLKRNFQSVKSALVSRNNK